ncbi:glycosyltransferase [Cohnella soli]|uniref:Glycosyltransferase n=1 Tax=Cohnella soli TaxID=425005 RepID=A0ABW0I3Y1_9BACL
MKNELLPANRIGARCKISVIVPVYNAGSYLADCVASLLDQTFHDCEFIFVNDGSTDRSGTILDELGQTDARMRIVHQTNQGVSMARNTGLALAEGEYIGFVDADDTIALDFYERLYEAAERFRADVVASNFVSEMGAYQVTTRYPFPMDELLDDRYITREVLPYFLKSDDFNTVCTKLYRAELIRRKGIAFPAKVALGEDGYFNALFYNAAARAVYLDMAGYLYRERTGSATRSIGEKDYFGRAVEVYESGLPESLVGRIESTDVARLKAVRFIRTLLSIIHVYFAASTEMSLRNRYSYVRRAIRHEYVGQSMRFFYDSEYRSLGKFDKLTIVFVRHRMTFGLYGLALYSRIRNK